MNRYKDWDSESSLSKYLTKDLFHQFPWSTKFLILHPEFPSGSVKAAAAAQVDSKCPCCSVAGKCSCQVPISSWHCFPSNFLIHAPGRSDGEGADVTASSPLIPQIWFLFLDFWCHRTQNLLPFASNTSWSMGFALLPSPPISTMLKTELVLSIWADCIDRPSLWVQQQTWFQPYPCLSFPSMGGVAFEAGFLFFCFFSFYTYMKVLEPCLEREIGVGIEKKIEGLNSCSYLVFGFKQARYSRNGICQWILWFNCLAIICFACPRFIPSLFVLPNELTQRPLNSGVFLMVSSQVDWLEPHHLFIFSITVSVCHPR